MQLHELTPIKCKIYFQVLTAFIKSIIVTYCAYKQQKDLFLSV